MDRRLQFQALLESLLGSSKVYFQPPPNVKIEYPGIVYQRDDAWTVFAGNRPYSNMQRYQVTLVDRNPDSPIREKVASLPCSSYERWFAANNLNHDVFVVYY